jgi:hypothetical protein
MIVFATLLQAIAEDLFGFCYDRTIFFAEYMLSTAEIIVLGIAFLIATFFRREKALYSDIKDESALYNCAMFIGVTYLLVTLIYTVYQYLCGSIDRQMIISISIYLFVELLAIFYLIVERKLLKKGRFIPYYSMVVAVTVPIISCSMVACSVYTPISLIRALKKSNNIYDTVNNIANKAMSDATTAPANIDSLIQEMNDNDRINVSEGDIKYTKIDEKKFSLSWKVELDPESLKDKRRLEKHYDGIFHNYASGRCSLEFSVPNQ